MGTERQTALFRWLVFEVAQAWPQVTLRDTVERLLGPLPPKVRQGRRERLVAHLLRATRRPADAEILEGWLREVLAALAEQVRDRPEECLELLREGAVIGVAMEWVCTAEGERTAWERVLEQLSDAERPAVDEAGQTAVDWSERHQETLAWNTLVGEAARAAVAAGLDQAVRQEALARSEAARAIAKTRQAAKEAGSRVAEAERRCQALEGQVAELRVLLAERDEQVARIVADYEQRLAAAAVAAGPESPVKEAAPPLQGLRVLVVADPNRLVGYRAEAQALGAAAVDFVNGMAVPGERLQSATEAADLVVLNVSYAKHTVEAAVRSHLRAGARVVRMRQSGLRAFRDSVVGALGRGP